MILSAALMGCGGQGDATAEAPSESEEPAAVAEAPAEGATEAAESDESEGEAAGEEAEAAEPAAQAAVIPPFCPTDGAPQAGAELGDHRFTIRAFADADLRSGEVGQFKVHVEAAEGWHVNQDFNTQLKVRANEGLRLQDSVIQSAQAAEFTDHHAYFDVPVTPQAAGEHRAESCLSFAICSDETCIPVAPSVAVVLPVQ